MQIVEVPFTFRPYHQSGQDRSEGLHQSDIIKDLCRAMDPDRFGGGGTPETPEDLPWDKFTVGFMWEQVLSKGFAELARVDMHPGEVTLDGVAMSPDGVNKELDCLEEYKATYMSSRDCDIGHDKFWHWRVQAMGYCKAMGFQQCIFRVLFICGDYTYPIGPQIKSWICHWEQEEIDQNWTMLSKHAKRKGL